MIVKYWMVILEILRRVPMPSSCDYLRTCRLKLMLGTAWREGPLKPGRLIIHLLIWMLDGGYNIFNQPHDGVDMWHEVGVKWRSALQHSPSDASVTKQINYSVTINTMLFHSIRRRHKLSPCVRGVLWFTNLNRIQFQAANFIVLFIFLEWVQNLCVLLI